MTREYQRFVAIGDSQTEGLYDVGGDGRLIGWADRLARYLAEANPAVLSANLAVRGKVSAEIYEEQLQAAIDLDPDLVTVMCGVNDVRHSSASIDEIVEVIEDMYVQLGRTGATVVGFTFPRMTEKIPLAGRLTPLLEQLNQGIRFAAERHDAVLVDLEGAPIDPRHWSEDRIHLSQEGHSMLAEAVAGVLGLVDAKDWPAPSNGLRAEPRAVRAIHDALWVVRFVMPSLVRRARRRSTGAERQPKRPNLEPVMPWRFEG